MSLSSSLSASIILGSATIAAASPNLELAFGGGLYESATNRASETNVSGYGGGGELQVGLRVTPHVAVGVYATFEAAEPRMGAGDHRGASAGARIDWHFTPQLPIDPWLSVGTGTRYLWIDDATTLRGLDLVRLQFGGDYRLTRELAIGPVVGVSTSVFFDKDMGAGFETIEDKTIDLVITAGVRFRFDGVID